LEVSTYRYKQKIETAGFSEREALSNFIAIVHIIYFQLNHKKERKKVLMGRKKGNNQKQKTSSSTSKRSSTNKETPNSSIHEPTEKKSCVRNPTNHATEVEAPNEDVNMKDNSIAEIKSNQKEVRCIDNE
jgi:hypothetical protein